MPSFNSCFLEHQLIKPLAIGLVVMFAGLVGWVGMQNVARVESATAGLGSGDPVLGFQIINPDELVARMFSFPPGEAVLVNQVLEGSPAARAGLRRGDGIVAVDGTSITSTQDFAAALGRVKRGQLLNLTIIRGGLVERVILPTDRGPK